MVGAGTKDAAMMNVVRMICTYLWKYVAGDNGNEFNLLE